MLHRKGNLKFGQKSPVNNAIINAAKSEEISEFYPIDIAVDERSWDQKKVRLHAWPECLQKDLHAVPSQKERLKNVTSLCS